MIKYNVTIQDTWDEEDDKELRKYVEEEKMNVTYLTGEDILKNFKIMDVVFADSSIIGQIINRAVVDTYLPYPPYFNKLYHRTIRKVKFTGAINYNIPFFIKPATNDKRFTGLMIEDVYDIKYIDNYIGEEVYISSPVKFKNEYRLFIAYGEIDGMVESTEVVIGRDKTDSPPPIQFLDTIKRINGEEFCVIDVGQLEDGRWTVVEVNPPFAISRYDWPIEKYFKYCVSAWTWLTSEPISIKSETKNLEFGYVT